ncbi:Uncharacterised protein [Mycobacteroides abscessus subsp. abscessus]|nr:Uncharacterised protein [Mycobacteroides abscessus subsp. abscessus]
MTCAPQPFATESACLKAASASSSEALRTWSATLAGFSSMATPGYSAAMADSLVAMVFNSALASPSMACTKPASNSEP